MPDATNTQTPAEDQANELVKSAAEYHAELINGIVPDVIVNRLIHKHGFVIKDAAQAQKVVAASINLFNMEQEGLLELPKEESDESPLLKAANEVLNLSEQIRNQYDSGVVTNHFLGNEDLMNKALMLVNAQA
jgi:hypothetical protein